MNTRCEYSTTILLRVRVVRDVKLGRRGRCFPAFGGSVGKHESNDTASQPRRPESGENEICD